MKLLCLAGALCCATAAVADDSTAPPPAPAKVVKEKKICRREDVIGQVIPAHICLTKAEWVAFDKHYNDLDQSFMQRRRDQFGATPTASGQISGP